MLSPPGDTPGPFAPVRFGGHRFVLGVVLNAELDALLEPAGRHGEPELPGWAAKHQEAGVGPGHELLYAKGIHEGHPREVDKGSLSQSRSPLQGISQGHKTRNVELPGELDQHAGTARPMDFDPGRILQTCLLSYGRA